MRCGFGAYRSIHLEKMTEDQPDNYDDTRILDEDTYKNIISNPTEPLVAAYTLKFMLIRVKA